MNQKKNKTRNQEENKEMQSYRKELKKEKKMRTINQRKQDRKWKKINKNELNRKHNCNIKGLELVALKAVIGRSWTKEDPRATTIACCTRLWCVKKIPRHYISGAGA